MKCEECCYYWKEENEDRAYCHWEARCAGDMAPCEYENEDFSEAWDDFCTEEDWGCSESAEDLEMGFDPYSGCYTWDC